jgi:transcriptional regulator EpsA
MTPPDDPTGRARAGPDLLHSDAVLLIPEQAQALVRLAEGAPAVRRRHQFFVWTQSQMQALLPHQLLVCGAYQRQRRALVLDAFHNVVLPGDLLQTLTDTASPLLAALLRAWLDGRGRPQSVALAALSGDAAAAAQRLQDVLGWHHLLLHACSRPQRLAEIETLFIVGAPGAGSAAQQAHRCACLELLLPHLHSTWQRTAATELELQGHGVPPALLPARLRDAAPAAARPQALVTPREQQILRWVREGLSNQEIAQVLEISPLTVKNHVQKILRKLNAGNRAQAVALALARQLIGAAELGAPATDAQPPRVPPQVPPREPPHNLACKPSDPPP